MHSVCRGAGCPTSVQRYHPDDWWRLIYLVGAVLDSGLKAWIDAGLPVTEHEYEYAGI